MRAAKKWIAEGDGQSIFEDTLPLSLATACFSERLHDDDRCQLINLVNKATKDLLSGHIEMSRIRLRAFLRVILGIAVHCKAVDVKEYEGIVSALREAGSIVSGELRYIVSGGTSAHSRAYPFSSPDIGIDASMWRSRGPSFGNIGVSMTKIAKDVFSRDVIVKVLSFCDARTICQAALVSNEWHLAEGIAGDSIWRRVFLRQWPNARQTIAKYKDRYQTRLRLAASRKVSFGRRLPLPRPIFCPLCDLPFNTESHCNKHICKNEKQPRKRRKKGDLIELSA